MKPHPYQLEIFARAKRERLIAFLPTGSGKTLISIMLMEHAKLEGWLQGTNVAPHRVVVFVAGEKKILAEQQARVIRQSTSMAVGTFTGDTRSSQNVQIDSWSRDDWNEAVEKLDVLVVVPEVLRRALAEQRLGEHQIALLVVDEAHHAQGNHPMARIFRVAKEIRAARVAEARASGDVAEMQRALCVPHAFCMTASPIKSRVKTVDGIRKAVRDLEDLVDCRLIVPQSAHLDLQDRVITARQEWVSYKPESRVVGPELFMDQRTQAVLGGVVDTVVNMDGGITVFLPTQAAPLIAAAHMRFRHATLLRKAAVCLRTARGQPDVREALDHLPLSLADPRNTTRGWCQRLERGTLQCVAILESSGILAAFHALSIALSRVQTRDRADCAVVPGGSGLVDVEEAKRRIDEVSHGPFGDAMDLLADDDLAASVGLLELFAALVAQLSDADRAAVEPGALKATQKLNDNLRALIAKILGLRTTPRPEDGIVECGASITTAEVARAVAGPKRAAADADGESARGTRARFPHVARAVHDMARAVCAYLTPTLRSGLRAGERPWAETNDRDFPMVSDKLFTVLELVQRHVSSVNATESSAGIVFVQLRLLTRALCDIFKAVFGDDPSADVSIFAIVGGSIDSYSMSVQAQHRALRSFRDASTRPGSASLLLATDVAEEGLDVPQCSLAICFDLPSQPKSLIQRRGRCRRRGAVMYILAAEGSAVRDRLEAFEMQHASLTAEVTAWMDKLAPEHCLIETAEDPAESPTASGRAEGEACASGTDVLRIPSTGAMIDAVSALELLNEYATAVASEGCASVPLFAPDALGAAEGEVPQEWRWSILLPSSCPAPVRFVLGPPRPSKRAGKAAAALEAVRKLHAVRELDDHLRPIVVVHRREEARRMRQHNLQTDIADEAVPSVLSLPEPLRVRLEAGDLSAADSVHVYRLEPDQPLETSVAGDAGAAEFRLRLTLDGLLRTAFVFPTKLDERGSIDIEMRLTVHRHKTSLRRFRLVRCGTFAEVCERTNAVSEHVWQQCLAFHSVVFASDLSGAAAGTPPAQVLANLADGRAPWVVTAAITRAADSDSPGGVLFDVEEMRAAVTNLSAILGDGGGADGAAAATGDDGGGRSGCDDNSGLSRCVVAHYHEDGDESGGQILYVVQGDTTVRLLDKLSDVQATSAAPTTGQESAARNQRTFLEHFQLKETLGDDKKELLVRLSINDQHTLLAGHPIGRRGRLHHVNALVLQERARPSVREARRRTSVKLVPELVYKVSDDVLWYEVWRVLPSALWQVRAATLADDARDAIVAVMRDRGHGAGIDAGVAEGFAESLRGDSQFNLDRAGALQAITHRASKEPDFERLEFVGDVYLKFRCCVDVYWKNPFAHEATLSVTVHQVTCNDQLFDRMVEHGLDKFLRYEALGDNAAWKPTRSDENEAEGRSSTRTLKGKVVADVCEAFVGACYFAGGMAAADTLLLALGIVADAPEAAQAPVEPKTLGKPSTTALEDEYFCQYVPEGYSPLLRRIAGLPEPSVLPRDVGHGDADPEPTNQLANLGRAAAAHLGPVLGYEFRDVALLGQALTHASMPLQNNQRLEFIGDAILDWAVSIALVREFPEAPPGVLTQARSLLVRNSNVGLLAIKLGLHRFLRHCMPGLADDVAALQDYMAQAERGARSPRGVALCCSGAAAVRTVRETQASEAEARRNERAGNGAQDAAQVEQDGDVAMEEAQGHLRPAGSAGSGGDAGAKVEAREGGEFEGDGDRRGESAMDADEDGGEEAAEEGREGGVRIPKALSDAFEAVIGCLYLDSGGGVCGEAAARAAVERVLLRGSQDAPLTV
ncbi:unnamed protein product [Pedinophyceae sp. YPF-701]|nr:unnamed protein product [Pedinophyceae sp. YPF-701]